MSFYIIVVISLGVLFLASSITAVALDLNDKKGRFEKAIRSLMAISLFIALTICATIYFFEKNLVEQNELSRRDYTGIVYYKYQYHQVHRYSCQNINGMIIKLFDNKKIHIKKVNYVTFSNYSIGDTISFNLTDEDIFKEPVNN